MRGGDDDLLPLMTDAEQWPPFRNSLPIAVGAFGLPVS
jgi:hypothetical protein